MIRAIIFLLLLAFFVIVVYNFYSINSEDRDLVVDTMVNKKSETGGEEEGEGEEDPASSPLRESKDFLRESKDFLRESNHFSGESNHFLRGSGNFLRSNILGSDMLRKSMWFGFGRTTKEKGLSEKELSQIGQKKEKVGVSGEFGDVVKKGKNEDDSKKNKESGNETTDFSKEFEKDLNKKPEEYKVVPISKSALELKPKDLSNAKDNSKKGDNSKKEDNSKMGDKDEDNVKEEKGLEKIREEAKFKAILGENKMGQIDTPLDSAMRHEKLIPKVSLKEKELTKSDLKENVKQSDLKETNLKKSHHHHKSNLKKSHHKSSLRKSHHKSNLKKSQSNLQGGNMDLNTLLTVSNETEN